MLKAVTQVIADIKQGLRQSDRPPICELRNIGRISTERYELLRGVNKEVENTVDINGLEAVTEKTDVYEHQIIPVRVNAEYKFVETLRSPQAHLSSIRQQIKMKPE